MIANILIVTLVGLYLAIVILGHILLLPAIWPFAKGINPSLYRRRNPATPGTEPAKRRA